eukprot:4136932-Pyramimonas_sp.AAC.2
MEEDFDNINDEISLSRELSLAMEEDLPARGKRWSPHGSDEDTSILTPQADRTEAQTKHEG